MPHPTTAELRRSALIRVAISVVVAGAITAAAIVGLWSELDIKTDVVGNPVFSNFNGNNYFRSYYLVAAFFPLAALGLFLLLTRFGPRFGLAPPPRGGLHPPETPAHHWQRLEGDPPLGAQPVVKRHAIQAARIGFVGGILGLEAGITIGHVWTGLALGIVLYGLLALLAAALLTRRAGRDRPPEAWLSVVNAILTPLVVLGFFAVSQNTELQVLADGSIKSYPWFPIWLALPAAAALAALIAVRLGRDDANPIEIERRTLLWIAAPACLFLLLALLPGNQSNFETFEAGQRLAGGELVGEGLFPWRDVFVAHGLLADVIQPLVGFFVFDDSYWGDLAGGTMLLGPLYIVTAYFLYAYLFGRNWLFLLFVGLILLDSTIAPADFRLIFWPLVLVALAGVLARPTPAKTVALAFMAVGQAFITPESAPALVALTVVLVLYEWYWREPRTALADAFRRTIWFVGAGIVFTGAAAAYLATRGALDDLIYITVNLLKAHSIDGALPPNGPNVTVSSFHFYFMALAPPAALLIAFAYAVARLRMRLAFRTEDWVMAAVAIFVFFYYSKFLARMDDHVYQPFVQVLPLLFYILFRAITSIERSIRERWPRSAVSQRIAHPICLALVVAVGLTSPAWRDRVADAPDHYTAEAVKEPHFERVGYVDPFEGVAYLDLRRVVDSYLDPSDKLFDLTGEPGLFFYLMEREPSTRYTVTNSVTDTAELQSDVIDQLREERPKLIVFDNTSPTFFGISNYDGTPSMVRQYLVSQWILDRYRPLLTVHAHTFYARRNLPPVSKAGLDLREKPVTRGVEFLTQQCAWGYAPSFLSGPGKPESGARAVDANAHPAPDRITIVGWAGDPEEKRPVEEVIATLDGKVVGRTKPDIPRPDLLAFGLDEGLERSGFRIQVSVPSPKGSGRLRLYGVTRFGDVSQLVRQGKRPPRGTVVLGGRKVPLDPSMVWGQVNTVTRDRSLQLNRPPGSRWSDFRWMEIIAGASGFREGAFSLYDRRRRSSIQREISFQTLNRSPSRYVIPVGSCAQWHGYRARRLFLNFGSAQQISAVRLIR